MKLYPHFIVNCLKKISESDIFKDFNLVGGTCLSLQLGHRRSIDIDLFTDMDYGSMNTAAMKVFERKFSLYRKYRHLRPTSLGILRPNWRIPNCLHKSRLLLYGKLYFSHQMHRWNQTCRHKRNRRNENKSDYSRRTQAKGLLGHL